MQRRITYWEGTREMRKIIGNFIDRFCPEWINFERQTKGQRQDDAIKSYNGYILDWNTIGFKTEKDMVDFLNKFNKAQEK
jgi:hypothetical protein